MVAIPRCIYYECVTGNTLKCNWHVPALVPPTLCPTSLVGYVLAGNGRPVFNLMETDLELHSLSTHLTRFPLAGCYHDNNVLQIPHSLCGAPQANPHFAAIPFSLESRQAAALRKTPHKLSSQMTVTQSLAIVTTILIFNLYPLVVNPDRSTIESRRHS